VIGYLAVDAASSDFASYYRERENEAKHLINEFYIGLERNGGI
jgi:hypothetical protein